MRKNRKSFDDECHHFEFLSLNDWMTELELSHEIYYADSKTLTVKEKGKIEDQTQIQNWLLHLPSHSRLQYIFLV